MDSDTPGMDPDKLEALYVEHFDALAEIAASEYGIAPAEAEQLADDVFIAGLRHLEKAPDPHQWLLAAIRDAARHSSSKIDNDGRDEDQNEG